MNRKVIYLTAITLLLPIMAWSQETVTIQGRVTCKGKGVPYATLQLQGSSVGVSCNDNGDYVLRFHAGHEQDTIIVRSMGYVCQKTTVAQLRKEGHIRLKEQAIELKAVIVKSYRSPRQLMNAVVTRIASNYHQRTAWSTFFYRDWRTLDDTLYLFDEAVMSMRRSPYSQYTNKRSYLFDPKQREMESNLKTLLRHRLVVYDRSLLMQKIQKPTGCDQLLAYADDENFFDPVATPQASYALAQRLLKEHEFEPLREFSADGEDYYLVSSFGPCRTPKVKVHYEYIIRKSDLALVRLVSAQQTHRRKAPSNDWVNNYFTSMIVEADTSVWSYEVRDGHYTLTRYCNMKSYRLEAHGSDRNGAVQRYRQSLDWVLTDFTLTAPDHKEQPLSVTPQTLAGAFGNSDYSSEFWGHYNYIPIDTLPLQLLNEKFQKP